MMVVQKPELLCATEMCIEVIEMLNLLHVFYYNKNFILGNI